MLNKPKSQNQNNPKSQNQHSPNHRNQIKNPCRTTNSTHNKGPPNPRTIDSLAITCTHRPTNHHDPPKHHDTWTTVTHGFQSFSTNHRDPQTKIRRTREREREKPVKDWRKERRKIDRWKKKKKKRRREKKNEREKYYFNCEGGNNFFIFF